MAQRWSNTNDQDGDGKKGGSISIAEAKRRAQQKEIEMARKPTPAAKKVEDEKTEDAKSAPSQPWASPAAKADSDAKAPATQTTPAPAPKDENPAPVAVELTEDEAAELAAFIDAQTAIKTEQLMRTRVARELEVQLIDSSTHYGNQIPRPRAQQVEE